MLDVTQVALPGPVAVSLGGVDVGHTDAEGVKLAISNELVSAFAGKYGGKAPVAKFLVGQGLEAEFKLIQVRDFSILNRIWPGALLTSSGGFSKLTFGRGAGYQLTPVQLVLSPFPATNDPKFRVTGYAVPVGDWELVYAGTEDGWWTAMAKFEFTIDEAGGSEGKFLFTLGDPTITADVTAPTYGPVTPANNAVGVSVAVAPVVTVSENLDGNTVNTGSVLLIADPLGAAAAVAGTVALVNAGAATTITFTPSAPLAALTQHQLLLRPGSQVGGIKDANGVSAPLFESDFTTA